MVMIPLLRVHASPIEICYGLQISMVMIPLLRVHASAIHAFLCHETNFFCVPTTFYTTFFSG